MCIHKSPGPGRIAAGTLVVLGLVAGAAHLQAAHHTVKVAHFGKPVTLRLVENHSPSNITVRQETPDRIAERMKVFDMETVGALPMPCGTIYCLTFDNEPSHDLPFQAATFAVVDAAGKVQLTFAYLAGYDPDRVNTCYRLMLPLGDAQCDAAIPKDAASLEAFVKKTRCDANFWLGEVIMPMGRAQFDCGYYQALEQDGKAVKVYPGMGATSILKISAGDVQGRSDRKAEPWDDSSLSTQARKRMFLTVGQQGAAAAAALNTDDQPVQGAASEGQTAAAAAASR